MKFNKTAVSLVLGGALLATVASIGGATAGALITGHDIKDGSIKKIDLSDKIKGDLAETGTEGATGPAGAKGDPWSRAASGACWHWRISAPSDRRRRPPPDMGIEAGS